MADESGVTSNRSLRFKKYAKEIPFFCKIFQLLLCVIALGLIVDPFDSSKHLDLNHIGLIYIAISGYIIINGLLIISYLYGERLDKKMGLRFVRVGAVLTFLAGAVMIYDWKNYEKNAISPHQDKYLDRMLASGILAIIASVFFAVELYLLAKEDEEDK